MKWAVESRRSWQSCWSGASVSARSARATLACAGALMLMGPAYAQEFDRRELSAPPGAEQSEFGFAAAIDANILVLGAPGADLRDGDATFTDAGAIYIYERVDGAWTLRQRIDSPVPVIDQRFGHAVDVDRTRIVVGAPGHAIARGFEPDGTVFEDLPVPGAAYTYVNGPNGWVLEAELATDVTGAEGWSFGAAVGVADDSILVGAPDGERVVPFNRVDDAWEGQWPIDGPYAGRSTGFGSSISIDGREAFVGAPGAEGAGGVERQGSVSYLTGYDPSYWVRVATFTGPRQAGAEFGTTIAFSQGRLAVGSPREDGVGGEFDAGRVRIYEKQFITRPLFKEVAVIDGSNVTAGARFGALVALQGDSLAIASGDESAPSLFRRAEGVWTPVASLAGPTPLRATAVAIDQQSVVIGSAAADAALLFGGVNEGPARFEYLYDARSPIASGQTNDVSVRPLGGEAPVTVDLVSGEFPVVGTIDQETLSVRGATKPEGRYEYTVAATDGIGRRIERTFVVEVVESPRTPEFFALDGVLGRGYEGGIRFGSTPRLSGKLRVLTGGPPPGTELLGDSGSYFTGIPSDVGRSDYVVRFEHSDGRVSDDVPVTITVRPLVDLSRTGRSRERVRIGAGSDGEVLRIVELLAGSALDVSLSGPGAETVSVSMTTTGDVIGLSQDTVDLKDFVSTAPGALRVQYVTPTTARYFIRLSADQPIADELRLSIRARAPRRYTGTIHVSQDVDPVVFFDAPARARVLISARTERGSAARMRLDAVRNRNGVLVKRKRSRFGKRVRANFRVSPEDAGESWFILESANDASGVIRYQVRVRAGRGYRFDFIR